MSLHNPRIDPKWRVTTADGWIILREGETRKPVEESARKDLASLQETGILKRRIPGSNDYEEISEIK